MFHAVPDAAKVDCIYPVELLRACVSYLYGRRLNARVVVCSVQAAEGGYSLCDHVSHLDLICHVATYADCLVARCGQRIRSGANSVLVNISKCDCSPGVCKGVCGY